MARTALQLSDSELASYRPGRSEPYPGIEKRLARARETARIAADVLRHRFGATRVVVFGSLVRPEMFTPWSDIDLAAWRIPADEFFRAVGAVSGLSEEFKIDLVDPALCRPSLRQEIEREGEDL